MPVRKVQFVHLTDGFVRTCIDDGCNAQGEPNIRRGQMLRLLEKTVVEKDEHGQPIMGRNGRPVRWPMVRLAKPPARLEYNMTVPKEAACASADVFDDRHLCNSKGDYLLAEEDRDWLEASERFQAKRKARADEADAMARAKAQATAGQALTDLMAHLTQADPKTAAKVRAKAESLHG